jgi:hypothetical protein
MPPSLENNFHQNITQTITSAEGKRPIRYSNQSVGNCTMVLSVGKTFVARTYSESELNLIHTIDFHITRAHAPFFTATSS